MINNDQQPRNQIANSALCSVSCGWSRTSSRSSRCARPAGRPQRHSRLSSPSIPDAVRRGRGERWVEGIFGLHARHVGNAVGYDTIAASGDHACTLHWIRNDGDLREGDLLLLDAGIELDSLYTADITRTMPINGTLQRRAADGLRGGARGTAGRHRRRAARCHVL